MKMMINTFTFFLLVCSAAAQAPPLAPILDTDGQELKTGIKYLIFSALWGPTQGEITLAPNRDNETCPLDVVLARPVGLGLPVTFHLPVSGSVVGLPVRASTNINIQFSTAAADTSCDDGGVWTVQLDPSISKYGVTTGGELGGLGPKTVANWFKIEPIGSFNKLVYCPDFCDMCIPRPMCQDLSLVSDGVSRRLVVAGSDSQSGFPVVFVRDEGGDSGRVINMPTDN